MPNRNRPTCILCRDKSESRAIRVGVWLCKRHYLLVVRLVKLLGTKLLWHDADLRETYTRIMRPHETAALDICESPTQEAKHG